MSFTAVWCVKAVDLVGTSGAVPKHILDNTLNLEKHGEKLRTRCMWLWQAGLGPPPTDTVPLSLKTLPHVSCVLTILAELGMELGLTWEHVLFHWATSLSYTFREEGRERRAWGLGHPRDGQIPGSVSHTLCDFSGPHNLFWGWSSPAWLVCISSISAVVGGARVLIIPTPQPALDGACGWLWKAWVAVLWSGSLLAVPSQLPCQCVRKM